MNPVHTLPSYVFKIHFNIILLPMPRPSKWSLSFRFSNQSSLCIFHLSPAFQR
jgi:hypothetical protein